MTRSVEDAAILLSIISGKDQNDDATLSQPSIVPDFTKALKKDALKGKRIGVPRRVFMDEKVASDDPSVGVAFEEALNVLRSLGATVVDPANLPSAEDISKSDYETLVLEVECKVCFTFNHCSSIILLQTCYTPRSVLTHILRGSRNRRQECDHLPMLLNLTMGTPASKNQKDMRAKAGI
jgi:Asp-tRNA(Asn)/Glu-tRNA(Gln) amidotransferase A subunit family amidase